LARRFGATDSELEALATGDLSVFAPRERLALRFAEKLTLDSNGIDDAFFAELRRDFDEGEMVEIAAVAGLFNYFNRFNNALQVEPTR
jgi:alkylhydroperoxidase family enzyme